MLSVPYSSGSRLLESADGGRRPAQSFFQSPIRRGRGCWGAPSSRPRPTSSFQSPIRRGRGCWRCPRFPPHTWTNPFSPLFVGVEVAGQSSPLDVTHHGTAFSPLFVGVEVAGGGKDSLVSLHLALSVPYSSGSRLLVIHEHGLTQQQVFQSPIRRGRGCWRRRTR